MSRSQSLRGWIAVAFFAFAVVTFPPVFRLGRGILNCLFGTPKIEAFVWEATTVDAIQIHLSLSSTLFQTALGLGAAIWGTLIVKKAEAGVILKEWPERLMLLAATMTLLSSGIAHVIFVDQMSFLVMSAAETQRIPDLTHTAVVGVFRSQCIALIGAAMMILFIIIRSAWLKPDGSNTNAKQPSTHV